MFEIFKIIEDNSQFSYRHFSLCYAFCKHFSPNPRNHEILSIHNNCSISSMGAAAAFFLRNRQEQSKPRRYTMIVPNVLNGFLKQLLVSLTPKVGNYSQFVVLKSSSSFCSRGILSIMSSTFLQSGSPYLPLQSARSMVNLMMSLPAHIICLTKCPPDQCPDLN